MMPPVAAVLRVAVDAPRAYDLQVQVQGGDVISVFRQPATKVNALLDPEGLWWDVAALKSMRSWAGHVGRMGFYDGERFV